MYIWRERDADSQFELRTFYEAGYSHHLMYLTYHKISEE